MQAGFVTLLNPSLEHNTMVSLLLHKVMYQSWVGNVWDINVTSSLHTPPEVSMVKIACTNILSQQ